MNKELDKVTLQPKKFLVWLLIASSFIFFAGLTSGFIVYTAGSPDRGIKVTLPYAFIFSTLTILMSSFTMHKSYEYGKQLNFKGQKTFLLLTILLGIAFFFFQLQAWKEFVKKGVYFVNYNASQSFIYVFTGAHLLHVLAGLAFLIHAFVGKLQNIGQVRNLYRLQIASIFWHFIDILWVYLYVFLLLNS